MWGCNKLSTMMVLDAFNHKAVLAFSANDVHVQMGKSGGDGQRHLHKRDRVYRASTQKVEQRSILVVIRDQPQLGPSAVICDKD